MTDPTFDGPKNTGGLNHPTIIAALYLGSFVTGISGIVGIILAFVWKGEAHAAWEESHYTYLINTFWIFLAGTAIGVVTALFLIGFVILGATSILVVLRCVLSLVNAQKEEPMPNPGTWLA